MQTKTYQDLLFWQNAVLVSKLIIRLATKLPRFQAVQIIISQLLRSSMSIGANIAEGYGRYGTKEYLRFLQVALGSANETEYWLILLSECCPKFFKEIEMIIERNKETIKMLAASLKSLRNKRLKN